MNNICLPTGLTVTNQTFMLDFCKNLLTGIAQLGYTNDVSLNNCLTIKKGYLFKSQTLA